MTQPPRILRRSLLALALVACAHSVCLAAAAETAKPNILFLLADDLAYSAIHSMGNDEVQTPNLDRLAQRGMTFTHAYVDFQRAVTMDGWKLLLYPDIRKVLLFHLTDDPLEMHNLAGDDANAARIKTLFAELLRWQKETGDKLDLTVAYPELRTDGTPPPGR